MAIPKPITRVEQYLAHISGMRVNVPEVPLTREEMYLASWAKKSGIEDAEMQGDPPLTLKDCIGEPFKGLVLYGKSTQVTTTGAQLLDIPDGKQTIRGVTVSAQNGLLEISGTATETGYALIKIEETTLNGTYALSVDRDITVGLLNGEYEILVGSWKAATVEGETAAKLAFFVTEGTKYLLNNVKVMFNAGDTALPWEPYTGGKPSPSPDYPQEIKSVGDDGNVSIIVKNPDNERMQSVPFSTPNGLSGIPVSSGGNYTDGNGQQWICDEVDLERGVYVQRVAEAKIKSETVRAPMDPKWYDSEKSYSYEAEYAVAMANTGDGKGFCSHLSSYLFMEFYNKGIETGWLGTSSYGVFNFSKSLGICKTSDEFLTWIQDVKIYKILESPIETPLSETDITAYRALTTYRGTTILESECGLKVIYSKLRK
nr:MAG TPA: hypothetical protein [Caudoviricetes sp.]